MSWFKDPRFVGLVFAILSRKSLTVISLLNHTVLPGVVVFEGIP